MRKYLTLCILLKSCLLLNSQNCTEISFGSTSGILPSIAANSGTGVVTVTDDLWNNTTGVCNGAAPGISPDGISDITISANVINTFDVYSNLVLNAIPPANKLFLEQSTTGYRGNIEVNTVLSRMSTGDVRGTKIRVDFANTPGINIKAENFNVKYTSGNTGGEMFESTRIIFLNKDGTQINTSTYGGYFTSANIVTTCPGTTPNINSSPWGIGTGIWTAQSTSTVIFSGGSANNDNCNPESGGNGPNDGSPKTVNATSDAGVPAGTLIGGFIWEVHLEDVAGGTDGAATTTNTTFTHTLNGFRIDQTILPVEISIFNVSTNLHETKMNFSTASETNNDYFTIERSGDGVAYEAIGEIKGAGNSSKELSYEFTDEKPLTGLNYYRIKQTDFDGKYSYSEVRSVRFTDGASVTVSPRTTEGRIDITTDMEDYNVEVYTAAGAQVKAFTGMNADQSISIEDLKAGIYFLRVSSTTASETVRVIKL